MPEQIKKAIDPLKARWDLLNQQQRYKLFGVIAAVLVALLLTAYFAFRTPWTVIVGNEDWRTTSEMQNALNNAGIRNEMINNGTGLQVDSRRVEEARSVITLEGAAPNDSHFTWENALDTGLGTTDDERRRRDILGMEGAIERQLVTMHGINSALVNLSIPNSRPFERDPDLPSASVTLNVSRDFSPTSGRRDLAMLVSMNISNLVPERIMIMDQFGRTIWNGDEDIQNDAVGAAQQAQQQHRNQATMGAMQVLSPAFDEVMVTFNPVFDDRLFTEEVREIFEIPEGREDTGIPHLQITSRVEVEGGAGGMEPGLPNNTAALVGYANPGGGEMSASQREEEIHFSINTTTLVTQSGPGWVDENRSTASVNVVTFTHVYQELWMAEEEGRTQADWERFKAESTRSRNISSTFDDFTSFHTLAARAVGIPTDNVSFVVMERIIPHDRIVRAWPFETIIMVAVLLLLLAMLLYGLLRRQRAAGEDEESLEPQLAVEDLLVSTQLEEAKEEAAQELEEIDYFKENEIKKHIEKFVNEKPEAVAALLRNWINVEEW